MTRPTPEEWLANFDATIADVRARTERFQQDLAGAGATETAPDGTLAVSVAPNGSLTGLRIDEAAWRGNGADLAARIMALARRAQRTAAVNVAEAFAPLGGPDSEALHMITGYLPEPEPAERDEEPGYLFNEEREAERAERERGEPPARPGRPPRSGPARGGADDEDFDDFGGPRIFRDDR